jgi:basic membrane protein A
MVEEDGKLKGLNSQKVVSSVGGQKIPPVDKYIAGYQAGVKAYCKDCKVLNSYSQDFVAQDKCKAQALQQIAQGSDIIFQVAGACGLGALDAAKSKGIWGIGVDADQSYLGPQILTSALKKVDVAVLDTIKSAQNGTFQGGADGTYGLAQGGVGLGKISPAAQAYVPRIQQVEDQVKQGKVTIPTTVP